jgi:hypothetical protein
MDALGGMHGRGNPTSTRGVGTLLSGAEIDPVMKIVILVVIIDDLDAIENEQVRAIHGLLIAQRNIVPERESDQRADETGKKPTS